MSGDSGVSDLSYFPGVKPDPGPVGDARESRRPLLLLIPGIDGTGGMFSLHAERLAERFRVHVWTYGPRADTGFADFVADLDHLTAGEPDGSVTIAAESFGGVVAMYFALARLERLRRLVLINTFAWYPGRVRIRLGRMFCPQKLWPAWAAVKQVGMDRVLALEGIPKYERRRIRGFFRTIRPEPYRRRLELVAECDLRDRLPEITVPTVLIASGRDKLVPSVAQAELMASRFPDVTVHTYPRAGHALLLTPGFSLADFV